MEAQRRSRRSSALLSQEKRELVSRQVPQSRREEILRYLELFGYKPERSILQVHIAGYIGTSSKPREVQARERAAARYGGRTFTILGRTHDPSIMDRVIKPRKQDANPGYVGYLFKSKDQGERSPDELLPLDFVPTGLVYPGEWRDLFATKGFLVAMHVPSSFAAKKNELSRRVRRAAKNRSAKKSWGEMLSEMEQYSFRNA